MGELVDGVAIGGNVYTIEAIGSVFISGEWRNLGKNRLLYWATASSWSSGRFKELHVDGARKQVGIGEMITRVFPAGVLRWRCLVGGEGRDCSLRKVWFRWPG